MLLLRRRGGDQRQCVLAYAGARPSSGHLCRLEVQRFGGGGAGRAEAFRLRGRETPRGAADRVDHAVGQVWVVVHHRGGGSMIQQPLIRRSAAAAADGARPPAEGDPGVSGAVLVQV